MVDNDWVINEWNNNHDPMGTKVEVKLDDGSIMKTTTRSVAWIVGGEPVVMVEGISGGYLLSRMKVIE